MGSSRSSGCRLPPPNGGVAATRNVISRTIDGLRWQVGFAGAMMVHQPEWRGAENANQAVIDACVRRSV